MDIDGDRDRARDREKREMETRLALEDTRGSSKCYRFFHKDVRRLGGFLLFQRETHLLAFQARRHKRSVADSRSALEGVTEGVHMSFRDWLQVCVLSHRKRKGSWASAVSAAMLTTPGAAGPLHHTAEDRTKHTYRGSL